MDQPNTQKRMLMVAALGVVILFILFIAVLLGRYGKAAVTVVVLPSDSVLTVDGKKTKPGTVYLSKTTHTLKATRPPLSPTTKTINFATYNTSQTLYLEPLPDSEQGLQYLLKHPEIQAQREAAESLQVNDTQLQLSKNKLIPLLPYRGPGGEYIIDYGAGTKQKTAIYIKVDTNQAKQDALNWIKSQKVDPKTLEIIYENLPADTSSGGGSEYQ